MTFTVTSPEAARDILARYQQIMQANALTIQIHADDGSWRTVTADELDTWSFWPTEMHLEVRET